MSFVCNGCIYCSDDCKFKYIHFHFIYLFQYLKLLDNYFTYRLARQCDFSTYPTADGVESTLFAHGNGAVCVVEESPK